MPTVMGALRIDAGSNAVSSSGGLVHLTAASVSYRVSVLAMMALVSGSLLNAGAFFSQATASATSPVSNNART